MKRIHSIERIHMRYVDTYDAGRAALYALTGQAVCEIVNNRTDVGLFLGCAGLVSWISSKFISNRAYSENEQHFKKLPVSIEQEHTMRLGPLDYITGIGMATLSVGVLNEAVAVVEHKSVARMGAGVILATLGMVVMGVGGHYRPDTELDLHTEDETALQEALDLLELPSTLNNKSKD